MEEKEVTMEKLVELVDKLIKASQLTIETMSKSLDRKDELINRLSRLFFLQVVCFCITIFGIVIGATAIYFCTDYLYPTVTQESKQQTPEGINQEVKQKIGKGVDR